jgi:hypothetical protein
LAYVEPVLAVLTPENNPWHRAVAQELRGDAWARRAASSREAVARAADAYRAAAGYFTDRVSSPRAQRLRQKLAALPPSAA